MSNVNQEEYSRVLVILYAEKKSTSFVVPNQRFAEGSYFYLLLSVG